MTQARILFSYYQPLRHPPQNDRHPGTEKFRQPSIDKVLRRIAKARELQLTDLHVCYEAGGGGMWLARQFAKIKVDVS